MKLMAKVQGSNHAAYDEPTRKQDMQEHHALLSYAAPESESRTETSWERHVRQMDPHGFDPDHQDD